MPRILNPCCCPLFPATASPDKSFIDVVKKIIDVVSVNTLADTMHNIIEKLPEGLEMH